MQRNHTVNRKREIHWNLLECLVLVIVLTVLTLRSGHTPTLILDICVKAAFVPMLLAAAQLFPMLSGSIDLSVSATCGACMIVFAQCTNTIGFGVIPALFTGMILGALNGLLVSKLKVSPAVITFCTAEMLSAFVSSVFPNVLTLEQTSVTLFTRNALETVFHTKLGPVESWMLFPILTLIVCEVILRYTRFGVSLYAVGESRTKSKQMGINPDRVLMLAHIMAGLLCGVAAVFFFGRFSYAQGTAGINEEMYAIILIMLFNKKRYCCKNQAFWLIPRSVLVVAIRILLSTLSTTSYRFVQLFPSIVMLLVIYMVYRDQQREARHW